MTRTGALPFAAELKALRARPDFRGTIDRGALALYLRHAYIPAPYSIYKRRGSPSTATMQGPSPRRSPATAWARAGRPISPLRPPRATRSRGPSRGPPIGWSTRARAPWGGSRCGRS
ncbi:MAG: hypothetical protein WKF75_01740 [Singulisphaera sp.]